MATPLPPDVAEALRRGEPLEAIRRLRSAVASLSLADAKRAVERAGRDGAAAPSGASTSASLQDWFRRHAAGHAAPGAGADDRRFGPGGTPGATGRPGGAAAPPRETPGGATWREGARPDPLRAPQPGDLSPGEVPRRGGAWALGALLAVALYAWMRWV